MRIQRFPFRGLITTGVSCLFLSTAGFVCAAEEPAEAPAKPNLLGWAEGAFTVRTPTPPRSEAHVVALDGLLDTKQIGIPKHSALPHEFIIELPALTRFESFAVPEIGEFGPAKGKHVKTVVIEGSTESPEAGFSPLTTFQIEIEKKAPQEFAVTIEGHTDSDGSDAHNLDLSQRRAQAVVNWLTNTKIAAKRLKPAGKGETEPLADNKSAVGRALNRRVEVEPQGKGE